jgi:hypothetical protein
MDGSEAWLREVRERKRGGPEGTAPLKGVPSRSSPVMHASV